MTFALGLNHHRKYLLFKSVEGFIRNDEQNRNTGSALLPPV
jgi:hypothetical protein